MEYLDSVSGGDIEIIIEIVTLFKEQAEEIYNEMKINLSSNDHHNLGLLAHKAKSSVAIIGMKDLANILRTLELDAKEGREPEMYASYVESFRADTNEAIKELDNVISKRLKNN